MSLSNFMKSLHGHISKYRRWGVAVESNHGLVDKTNEVRKASSDLHINMMFSTRIVNDISFTPLGIFRETDKINRSISKLNRYNGRIRG